MKLSLSILLLLAVPGLAAAADIPPAVRAACTADAKAHCKGVMPGGGRIVACFAENAGALSEKCSAALTKMSCDAKTPEKLKSAFPCKS